MKLNLITWISLCTLFVFVTSCEDHRIPTQQRFRIKAARTVSPGPNVTRITTGFYNYDSNGRLARYVSSTETNPVSVSDSSRTFLNYDAQGRIQNALTETWDLVNTASGVIRLWRPSLNQTYEYDTNGNITVLKLFGITKDRSQSPFLLEVIQFAYNGSKFPIKVTHTRASDNYQWIERYTYSGDNIVSVEKSDNQSTPTTTAYQYDNNPNPFYGLITGNKSNDTFTTFNRNNVVISGNQYLYDSNGLLSKVVEAGGIVNTYEYEAY